MMMACYGRPMLKRKTTFVIGAGSSWDFGFPLGGGLRDQIVGLLAVENPNASVNFSDPDMASVLRERATQEAGTSKWTDRLQVYRRAAAIIRDGLPFARSIDGFLDGLRDEPEVEFLGKLAIATLILRAESGSPLKPSQIAAANADEIRAAQIAQLVGSWHALLGQMLYDGHTRDSIDTVFEHASFVVFNYDRCIEEFFTVSLMRRFAINRPRALGVLAKCRIIHPYGQVGGFSPDAAGHVPFGEVDPRHLVEVASRIRTFTEAMEQRVADDVKDSIAGAEIIVFMGFGWLPQNMELLHASDRVTEATKVFATTKAMDPREIMVVEQQIDRMLRRKDYTPEYAGQPAASPEFISDRGDCKALMNNCWLRLTGA